MINILFKEILLISIIGSILFFFIICMKHLFKKIINVSSSYKLWFLMIICLLIPFIPVNLPDVIDYNNPNVAKSINSIANNIDKVEIVQFIQNDTMANNDVYEKKSNPIFKFDINIYALVWLIGVIGYFTYMCVVNYKIRKMIATSKPYNDVNTMEIFNKCKIRMKIKRKIHIASIETIEQPCIYGFFKPVILLSNKCSDTLSQKQKEYVFIHELSHYLRKDNLINWLLIALKIIYWFNPIIRCAINRVKEEGELACDALTLSYIEHEEHLKYAMTLLDLLDIISKSNYLLATVSIVSGRKRIERRINMICEFKKFTKFKKFISCFIALVIASIGITTVFALNNVEKKIENKIDENSSTVDNNIIKKDYLWPVPNNKTITSTYGLRINPLYTTEECGKLNTTEEYEECKIGNIKVLTPKLDKDNKIKFHNGIDILAPKGENVVASENGTIKYCGFDASYGNMVIIKHEEKNYTIYAHCSELLVKEGENVTRGQKIAKVGSTGKSTGPHVHFSIVKDNKIENPINYLNIEEISTENEHSTNKSKTIILCEKAYDNAKYIPKKVTISQTKVIVEGIEKEVQHLIPNPKLSFTFKNGKEYNIWNGTADDLGLSGTRNEENNTTAVTCEFDEKIDIENIKSITVDGIEYNLN